MLKMDTILKMEVENLMLRTRMLVLLAMLALAPVPD